MEHHNLYYQNVSPRLFSAIDELLMNNKEMLNDYIDHLLWWNKRINLISRNVSRETIWHHIHHSLLLSQFDVFKNCGLFVDAGTGGGLPGIPLALTHPDKHFILNDIVEKKVRALKQIEKKLHISNITNVCKSIDAVNIKKPYVLISKHAFKIDRLYAMIKQKSIGKFVFYKGLNCEDELESITDPLTVIVHDLFSGTDNLFYENKKIIVVSR